jgi:cytochrome P450
MTDRQLRDEAMTIVLAGHETTALALSWAWWLLARHPEAERRLVDRVDGVLGGRAPTVDDLPRLPEAEWVILEAMRLYPPIPTIGREATGAVEIGGHTLPAGANVAMSAWVVQRDGRFYAEPEAFRPERWADGLAKRLPRGAYFPFGGGPRLCIGQPFALIEAQLILATLAQRYRLELLPGHPVIPEPALTLRLKHGLRMRLHERRPEAVRTTGRPAPTAAPPG